MPKTRKQWHEWYTTHLRGLLAVLVKRPVIRRLADEQRQLVKAFDAEGVRRADYQRMIPTLRKLFCRTCYWHGTGRYQYHNVGWFQPTDRMPPVKDILQLMVNSGGLQPSYDAFGTQQDTHAHGVSLALARGRMYGRLYAEAHQEEALALRPVNGTTRTWYDAVMAEEICRFPLAVLAPAVARWLPRAQHQLQQRLSRRRRDAYARCVSLFEAITLGSDIRGNYGILCAIGTEVTPIPLSREYALVEVRTREQIPFSQMSHLEVPLAQVRETRRVLGKQGIPLTVIPLEYMDRYTVQVVYTRLINCRD